VRRYDKNSGHYDDTGHTRDSAADPQHSSLTKMRGSSPLNPVLLDLLAKVDWSTGVVKARQERRPRLRHGAAPLRPR
jgi:hypothetical protein